MARYCFAGNEIYPTTPGGAGHLVYNLAKRLLAEGHEVILLLDVSKASFEQFQSRDCTQLAGGARLRAYQVDALCARLPVGRGDFLSRYTWEAYRYDFACRQVYELEKPDLIEFIDYCGPAYYALNAKACGVSYTGARLVVRIHGPLECIDRSAASRPLDFDRYTAYALERAAFRLAESVLYATPSFLNTYYDRHSTDWLGQAVYAPPILDHFPRRAGEAEQANGILFYGRLFSVKGAERFVLAAVQVLQQRPDLGLQFYLAGYDSFEPPSNQTISYQEYLLQKIPSWLRERFIFTGHLERQRLIELLPMLQIAVIPSYFESFGYAAHELHAAGLPLILSPIPAFLDEFEPELNALFFDGSTSDLARQIIHLADEPVLRARLGESALGLANMRTETASLDFYRRFEPESWIAPPGSALAQQSDGLWIWIIDDGADPGAARRTLAKLGIDTPDSNLSDPKTVTGQVPTLPAIQVICLQRVSLDAPQEAGAVVALPFLDGLYRVSDSAGGPVSPAELRTRQALLILRAGDEVGPAFLARSLEILARQPQVGFVSSWKYIQAPAGNWLQTHPFPALSELALLEALSRLNRCVMRTQPGLPALGLFDSQALGLAEVEYLWRLEDSGLPGLELAQPLFSQVPEPLPAPARSELTYLLGGKMSFQRQANLARYLAMASVASGWLFPLQAAWAQKSGLAVPDAGRGATSILVQPGWRRRLYLRLSRGGKLSQQLLVAMQFIWRKLKR